MELVAIILSCLLLPLTLLDALHVSKEELSAMKKQLKFLNRPAIHTIHTEYGDIVDCVDVNKQPAFDHPLLKDHKIQMRPSMFPREKKVKGSQMVSNQIIGLPGGGCPNGTIPIRRTKIEDLIRAKSLSNLKNDGLYDDEPSHNRYAIFQNKDVGNFTGTEAWLNVRSPIANHAFQTIFAQFVIIAGLGTELNTINGGWINNVMIYGDEEPRLFVYWTADNYEKTGCYNIKCPGFVHVSDQIYLGMMLRYSQYDGYQSEYDLRVMKDPESGNWWLSMGDEAIGYWPKAIFTHLQGNAEIVQWGGAITNSVYIHQWPSMGSGQFAEEGYSKACYVRDVKVFDVEHNFNDFPDAVMSAATPCYTVAEKNEKDQRVFYFGGPGGNNC